MKFFLDTADLAEIKEAASWGAVAGVTTNPSLYAKIGGKVEDFEDHIVKICQLIDGPVSAEVTGSTRDEMVEQGVALAALAPNVVVKVPMGVEGLAATAELYKRGIDVNMTLIFSVPQALLAGRAGARYISPFVGRFDDIADDGIEQLSKIVAAVQMHSFEQDLEIIAASVRTPLHVTQAALLGADIATVPFGALKKAINHPLTDAGIAKFEQDWKKVMA